MRIVLTGGAGYIGGHTLVELLGAGHEVLVIDDLSTGSVVTLEAVQSISGRAFQFAKGDIHDADFLLRTFEEFRPNGVVHMAGLKSPIESLSDPLRYFRANVLGSINLLAAMAVMDCNRIVFSSSATVYGTSDRLPYHEDHPTNPTTPYGRSKLMVETILSDWAKVHERRAVSLRYFNPIGAHESGLIGDRPAGAAINLMPYIVDVAAGRLEALSVFGTDYQTRDGTGERDYVHVCDVATAHTHALDSLDQLPGHTVLNIGRGSNTTVFELVSTFERATGIAVPWRSAARRAGDLPSAWADVGLARTVLGWSARRSTEQMCVDSWRFNAGGGHVG